MMKPESIPVVYSDDSVIVVDKPAGILTTPAHAEISMVDILNQKFFGRFQLFVVHRLDRGTSGLLVFARTPQVAKDLALQFSRHLIEREYIAFVVGRVPDHSGCIDREVNGKKAKTYFEVKEYLASVTSLSIRLATGRRNQIRHHFSDTGFPVLGDERIGGERACSLGWPHQRIALHARSLRFWHPGVRQIMGFESSPPVEMEQFLDSERAHI
jgi:RluA family pseudouridine synthase